MAEAIKLLPQAPRRTILLAFWDGEEQGMLGSKHWVSKPTVPLKQVKFMINVDMIGRLRENKMDIIGTRSGLGMRKWLSEQNQSTNLRFNFVWELKGNSDHYVFFQQRIPVIMLHTGLHDNYHRPSDDPETINREGLQRITRMIFNITLDLANSDQVRIVTRQPANPRKSGNVLNHLSRSRGHSSVSRGKITIPRRELLFSAVFATSRRQTQPASRLAITWPGSMGRQFATTRIFSN